MKIVIDDENLHKLSFFETWFKDWLPPCMLSLWSNILRLRSLLSFFVKINNAQDLLAPNLFFFFFFLLLIYLIPPFFAEQQIFGIKDIGKKETTILDSRHKILYICVNFWLLFNLTRDLSQAKKKINVVTSWANAQKYNYFT